VLRNYFMKLIFLLSTLSMMLSAGFYYTNGFTIGETEDFDTNRFFYGYEGVVIPNMGGGPPYPETTTSFTINNSLAITGVPNNQDGGGGDHWALNGTYCGRYIRLTNHEKSAPSSSKPWGFTIERTHAHLDPMGDGHGTHVMKDHALIGLMLIEDDDSIDRIYVATNTLFEENKVAYKKYPHNFCFFDYSTREFENDGYDQRYGRMGYYYNGMIYFFTSEESTLYNSGPRGNAADLITMNVNYFDYNNVPNYDNLATANDNIIGYQLVHDGTQIHLYLNPDPRSMYPTRPNEYFWIHTFEGPEDFTNNLSLLIGHEARRKVIQRDEATWDNLRIQNATEESHIAFISPDQIPITPVLYKDIVIAVSNRISRTNAGVNVIVINMPSVLSYDMTFSGAQVDIVYDGAVTNTLSYTAYQEIFYSGFISNFVDENKFWIQTNKQDAQQLSFILGSQVSNRGGAMESTVAYLTIPVHATNDFLDERKFNGTVEALSFEGMTLRQYGSTNLGQRSSTCGPEEMVSDAATIEMLRDPSAGVFSISPDKIYQNEEPYNFSLTLKADDFDRIAPIKQVALLVPSSLSNCFLTNFDSIRMGDSEAGNFWRTNIPGLTNADSSNLLIINYPDDTEIAAGGFDNINFKIRGMPVISTNLVWKAWCDGAAVVNTSNEMTNNSDYNSTNLSVGAARTSRFWDFRVTDAYATGPSAMELSNIVPLVVFSLQADGENSETELITNVSFRLVGENDDIRGYVRLFRHTNGSSDTFTTNNLVLGTIAVDGLINEYDLSFADSNQSTVAVSSTVYWLALSITNYVAEVYTNTIGIMISNVAGNGPNGGLILNASNTFSDISVNPTRIDKQYLSLTVQDATTSLRVQQRSFNVLHTKLIIDNPDEDAVHYLTALTFSNMGTASNADISTVKLYHDSSPSDINEFVATNDRVVASSFISSNGVVTFSVFPAFELSGLSNVFWLGYDLLGTASLSNTIFMQIPVSSAAVTNIQFQTTVADQQYFADYENYPIVTNAFPLPGAPGTNVVIPFESRLFDFKVVSSPEYDTLPVSIKTGQIFEAGSFEIIMDHENTNLQLLTNVHVGVSGTGTGFSGIARLYYSGDSASFMITNHQPGADWDAGAIYKPGSVLLAETLFAGGDDIVFDFATNLFNTDERKPDTLRVVMKLTNTVSQCSNNVVSFSITNVLGTGPDNGVVSNMHLLGTVSASLQVDSGTLKILNISNISVTNTVKLGSFDNPIIEIHVAGDDPDGLVFIERIDMITNGGSTRSNTYIPTIKLYRDNNNTNFDPAEETIQSTGSLQTNGTIRLTFSPAFTVSGDSDTIFYIAFDVTDDEEALL